MPTDQLIAQWREWNTHLKHFQRTYSLPASMLPWHLREHDAQLRRQPLVWCNEPFWRSHHRIHLLHFPHASAKNPGLLAYTVNNEKGEKDVQTQIRPGRYLKQFFGHILTEKQIAYYSAWQIKQQKPEIARYEHHALKFATTKQEIVQTYMHGPVSCMDDDNFPNAKRHPCRVYAAGDLAIAYLTNDKEPNKVIARCLTWPEKKVAGRVYPTPGNHERDKFISFEDAEACQTALQAKLKAEGYKFISEDNLHGFDGAKLLKIEYKDEDGYRPSDTYVMPYLDHDYRVNDTGDYFTMHRSGDYDADSTNGTMRAEVQYDYCCDRCGEGVNDNADLLTVHCGENAWETAEWCSNCADNHSWRCEGSEELFSDDLQSIEVGTFTYSQSYAEENFYFCGRTQEWFDPDIEKPVEMANGDTWCQSAFEEHGFTCAIDGGNYNNIHRHPDHPEIHEGTHKEDIAHYLATQTEEEELTP